MKWAWKRDGALWAVCLGWVFVVGGAACAEGRPATSGSGGAVGAGGDVSSSVSVGGAGGKAGGGGSGGVGGGNGVCTPGNTMECYSGPAGSVGVGLCKVGIATCYPDGSGYGACVGDVTPQPEDCKSAEDEDCDGTATCGNVVWAKRFGDAGLQYAALIATMPDGSMLIAGTFGGTLDLGVGPLVGISNTDIFVAKLNSSGDAIWSRAMGGMGSHIAMDLAVDTMGRVYVIGNFDTEITMGGTKFVTKGGQDIFYAQFDTSGNFLQGKTFGSTLFDYAARVAVNANDDSVVLLTSCQKTVDFGGGPLTSAGEYDFFLTKYDAAGVYVWTKQYGEVLSEVGEALAIDAVGNILVTGTFRGSINLGGDTFFDTGNGDIFVAKFSPDGSHLFSKHWGATAGQTPHDIATDKDSNVWVAGGFYGPFDAGGGLLVNNGDDDTFLVKLDPQGQHLFSNRFGDAAAQSFPDIAIDSLGRVAFGVTYYAGGTGFSLGPSNYIKNAGNADAVFGMFNADGSNRWGFGVGDAKAQHLAATAIDSAGDVIFVGGFFGTMDLGGTVLTSAGMSDAYILKIQP